MTSHLLSLSRTWRCFVFASAITAALSSAPTSWAGDLNGDSTPDLVFSNFYYGAYDIDSYALLGTGGGAFAAPILLPTSGGSDSAVADLNGDGYQDIVFANNYSSGLGYDVPSTIYWGDATNSYASQTSLPTTGAYRVETADLNKDGYRDIVFANNGGASTQSQIYWGAAGANYNNSTNLDIDGATDVAIGDVNGDFFDDIVIARRYDNVTGYTTQSEVFWGAATNPYSTSTPLDTIGAAGVAVADLDKDGYGDIVFSNSRDDSTYDVDSYIYWGSPSGQFFARTSLNTTGAASVDIADVNGDGYLDIATSTLYDGTSYSADSKIFWGSADYSYTNETPLATTGASDVAVGDLNGDTYQDLVFAEYYTGASQSDTSTIYYGDASGTTFATTDTVPSQGANGVTIAQAGPEKVIDNYRQIDMGSLETTVDADVFNNHNLVHGDGHIVATVANALDGELRVQNGERLQVSGVGSSNAGEINILGGTVEFDDDLTNMPGGFIGGRGLVSVSGGLVNQGVMAFTGTTDVLGDVDNQTGGQIVTTAGGTTTFFDDVVHDGTEIRTSAGSSTVFLGDVSGGASTYPGPGFTGTGTVYFEGDLRPGNSPGIVGFEGDVAFGFSSATHIELAGSESGEFDQLIVAGDVDLGGDLLVSLLDGFALTAGESFTIVDVGGTLSGAYNGLGQDDLVGNFGGINLFISYAAGDGNDVALFTAPPLPGDGNGDGWVDGLDYLLWAAAYGTHPGPDGDISDGDYNDDGWVDGLDYLLWAGEYGNHAAAAVPEPAAGLLLATAILTCVPTARVTTTRRRN